MYATLNDVEDRLGRPTADPVEARQVVAWIGDVESLILARIPDFPERIEAGAPSAAVVTMVVCNAVIRKINNPDGKVSEGVDDYQYRYNEQTRKGELFLTDEEWALLSPAGQEGAFTIVPYGSDRRRGQWVHPDVWVPLP